jgi:hypothetical protein
MWESCLSGSERGWRATMERVKYCGTVGKPGGNRENKPHPKALGASSLLESNNGVIARRSNTASGRQNRRWPQY